MGNQMSDSGDNNGTAKKFPVGMNVLVVDNDLIFLKELETLLVKCEYQVTTTNQAIKALEMLRENRNKFDLIISEVNMPDMDGFKLRELVGLEMDLPFIMMSAHSDSGLVKKALTNGACDYLQKPLRMEELKHTRQHEVGRKKFDNKDQNKPSQVEKANNMAEEGNARKPRFIWPTKQHKKIVRVRLKRAVPKEVPEMMDVEGLTRENVASHRQKYKLYNKRRALQAEMLRKPDQGHLILTKKYRLQNKRRAQQAEMANALSELKRLKIV